MTWTTHSVFNQPQPLSNSNLFTCDAVKDINRHFDRRWRQLRLQLSNVREGLARDVTRDLVQLASAAILLSVAEPPLADGWCHQHLEPRAHYAPGDDLCARLLLRAGAR